MFEKLFGRGETEQSESDDSNQLEVDAFAPNTKIAYKTTLIPTLEKEHQDLLDLYDHASKAAHAKLAKRTRKLLSQFKGQFIDHILRENTSLYIYLQHSAHAGAPKKSISLIKYEMEKIGREVMQFLEYGIKESTKIDDEFIKRMDAVSKIIHKRIEYEEGHVYPNYLTKNKVSRRHNNQPSTQG